jgi:hypothetical protein
MNNGRPTKYTEDLAKEICTRLSHGESLRSICREDKFPTIETVLNWVNSDREGFFKQYTRAREVQSITLVDEALDYRHGLINGDIEPQAAKAAMDMIKWSAGRMNRKSFGDRPAEEPAQESKPQKVTIEVVGANTSN